MKDGKYQTVPHSLIDQHLSLSSSLSLHASPKSDPNSESESGSKFECEW